MILFLGFWILSLKNNRDNKNEQQKQLSIWETIFFIIAFLFVSLIPTQLFDGETERFSIALKLLLILPVIVVLYFLKKAPVKTD